MLFSFGPVSEEMKLRIVNSCFCQKFKFSPPFAVTFQLHERDFSAKLKQAVFDQMDLDLNPKSTVAHSLRHTVWCVWSCQTRRCVYLSRLRVYVGKKN